MALLLTVITGVLLGLFVVPAAVETNEQYSEIISVPSQMYQTKLSCKPCVCNITKDLRIIANCTARNLTSVPNISSVIDVLLMDSNQLVNLTSGCFSKYLNLAELNLAFNMITTIEIGSFQNLRHLQILNLTGNKLKYTETIYKSKIFKPLQNLKMLTLNNNNKFTKSNESLTYPDKAISDLASLKQLYVDGLTNQSFGKGFSNLSSLTHLSLTGQDGQCSLQFLFNTTFINVKNIRRLSLSHCDVRYIEPTTFSPLKSSLDVLDLSYNRNLRFDNFGIASFGLQNSTLRVLNISGIVGKYDRCVDITVKNVQFFSHTQVQELYADDNMIEFIEKGVLERLPQTLQKVSLKNSRFIIGAYIFEFKSLTGLKEISLGGVTKASNLPSPEPPSLVDLAVSAYLEENALSYGLHSKPALATSSEDTCQQTVNSRHTQNYSNSTNICKLSLCLPPNLKILRYTYSQLWYNVSTVMVADNNLTHLDLSYNFLSLLYGPVLGFENITYLNLSHNFVYAAYPSFFENFKSLEILDMSYNLLRNQISEDKNGMLFGKLISLKVLKLNNNNINKLHKNVFQALRNLEMLEMSRNGLFKVHLHVKHMTNLHLINMSHNMIRSLQGPIMSELDTLAQLPNNSVGIDLSFNPISCNCKNLHYLKWMLNSKVEQMNVEHYICLNYIGAVVPLSDIRATVEMLEDSCINYFGLALGSVFAVLLLLCIFLGGIMYRYRWKLRYWYYGARYYFKRQQANAENGQMHFEFDAFISYADEDRAFVFKEMMVMVESRAGKKLIIHQRDFVPGQPIVSNILESVKKSRKTVLVLSRLPEKLLV